MTNRLLIALGMFALLSAAETSFEIGLSTLRNDGPASPQTQSLPPIAPKNLNERKRMKEAGT